MSRTDDIINDVLRREGGYTNNPADRGGRTDKGITEKDHPEAWADGVVTDAEARAIFEKKYVAGPGFDKVPDTALMSQLVDFGVNSGPTLVIMKLQAILGVEDDGQLGPLTLAALATRDARDVGNQLAIQRIKMLGRICTRDRSQLIFLNGWINRACEFIR